MSLYNQGWRAGPSCRSDLGKGKSMHEAERARNNIPAPGRAPRLALLALAGAWLLSIAGAAGTQLDALTYLDPAVADARENFALRQRALAGLPGLHVSVTATPNLAYGTLATGEAAWGNDATLVQHLRGRLDSMSTPPSVTATIASRF